MDSSFFSYSSPISYFQPLQSPCATSFFSCEPAPYEDLGAKYESISSKVCGWAGELGKDHDLRQGAAHGAWREPQTPFQVSTELPSSELIPTAQRQPRVDFVSSATAMKSIFRASFDTESDVGVAVHRLGDWLVIDDGSELSWCPHRDGPDEDLWVERVRVSEQHHRACLAQVEAATAKSREAQQRLEQVRAMLWEAEMAASQADAELREALAEASRAAEACEHLKAPANDSFDDLPDFGASSPLFEDDMPEFCPQEDPQLFRNFLGHSIRQLQDEPHAHVEDEQEEHKAKKADASPCQGELVLLDGPPASFHQVGVWKIADDASVVVGSRLLCLGNSEHPKLTLYLHDDRMISDTMLLEHWVECLMAGVPEFAVCFHRDGAVQSYSLYKLSELQRFLEERMELGRRVQMTLEVLRWIKRQCRLEGCSYWLSKDKKDSSLKLIKLSNDETQDDRRQALADSSAVASGLVLKNTFLHLPEEDEAGDFRRALSCPARFLGSDDPCQVSPFCSRVSALFFRRAVSSKPGPDAARFFRQVLDLEAFASSNSDDDDRPPEGVTAGRVALQACSHLGLALCELSHEDDAAASAASSSASASARAAALLGQLRRDVPAVCARYRLLPMWAPPLSAANAAGSAGFGGSSGSSGSGESASFTRTAWAPLLFAALPPWPGASAKASPPAPLATALAAAAVALRRCGDAWALSQVSEEDRKRLEALAAPTSALALLRLASLAGSLSQRRQDMIWRALVAGRKFGLLDVSPGPDVQPLFAHLPSREELLLRLEYVSGRTLQLFAAETEAGASRLAAEDVSESLLDELENGLARLEGCAGAVNSEEDARHVLREGPAAWCVRAAKHIERSIRLLPQDIVEARSQRGCSTLLNQLMMTLSVSLSEAAVSSAELEKLGRDPPDGLPSEALAESYEQLCRAEDLAEAAGHKAGEALARASRGHLCSLAADAVVHAGLRRGDPFGYVLSPEEVEVLRSLCEDDEPDQQDALLFLGRLGDRAVSETFAARLDPIVEPDAAAVLAVMASGALQAAVARLRASPPPGPAEEQRRAVQDMLAQALQLLPGEGAMSSGIATLDRQAAVLAAQAHMALSEVLSVQQSRSGRQRQRAPWHLEKARSALHRASSGANLEGDIVDLLLMRAHLLAQILCQGTRKPEQGFEELISASHIHASMASEDRVAGRSAQIQAAWLECGAVLLDALRSTLRVVCTSKTANEGWKELYRFALKLEASELSDLVLAYAKL
ncbi:unnamed protein product [Effrenium voratum]|uniref:EDRF1 N-terminal domain-containing protein n=1 Tax=Effrenium voratum TaxID=2562239 RepID=A0AA36JF44_9DINO|nr:unnamed protein product [Effrenium voratum]